MTRRRFVQSVAGAVISTGCARAFAAGPSTAPVVRRAMALGAGVRITTYDAAGDVLDRALAEVARVDALLSLYRPDSQVSILNRDGRLAGADPDLLAVLRKCHALSERTDGAFDVTVQPLWTLYAAAKKEGKLPPDDAVARARALVDYRKIRIDGDRVELGKGMAVTLNAIAQGFAADAAADVLRRTGVRHAMIDTGEIATIGTRLDGEPWSVGIQHPREPDAYCAVAKLRDRCMSTSGDYATAFTDDHAYNHIFDPATGRSPDAFASVTIVAPRATDADGLSTACFVIGLERSLKLVAEMQDVEAMFVFKDGRTVATKGFPA